MFLKLSKHGELMNVREAMKFAGFSSDERKDETIKRQMCRKRDMLASPDLKEKLVRKKSAPILTLKAPLVVALAPKVKATTHASGMHQTTKQAHAERKHNAANEDPHDQAHIEACLMLHNEIARKKEAGLAGKKHKPKLAETICIAINAKCGSQLNKRVSARTVRECVKDGRAGMPLEKPGEKGWISNAGHNAFCNAVCSCATLAQQEWTKSSAATGRPGRAKNINAVINSKEGVNSRTGGKLCEQVKRDIAVFMDLGEPNRTKQRRKKWNTHDNINKWHEALKAFLIEKGFATEVPGSQWQDKGKLVFHEDQGGRLANLNESPLALNDTANGKGGGPAGGLCDSRIANAPTHSAHKSSHSATMVAGCFTEEAFPLHFQTPSKATKEENQGMSFEFIEDLLDTQAMRSVQGTTNLFLCLRCK